MHDDPYNLQRFIDAHEGDFDRACRELKHGRKETHWMWFIFPQLKELGVSRTSQFYGLSGLAEARAYLEHPVLSDRLEQVTGIVIAHQQIPLHDIFGSPDDMKFRSSMTIFAHAGGKNSIYANAIEKLCRGEECAATLALLNDD